MELITTLLITVIAATLSANLAVGRFKKERAWEKKEEAFSLLIKGTRSSINYSDAFLEQRCSPYSYISDEDLERLNEIREESINAAREIMNSHYLFMTESEVVIVKSLIEGLKFPDYLDSQEMAEQDLEHHSELLKEIEKSAKESLHIEQSNTYLLLSRLWKHIDKLLEPAVKKSQ